MAELKSPQAGTASTGSGRPARASLPTRLLLRDSLSARRAAAVIAGVTLLVTIAGGLLARVLDHQEYPTIGKGLWFSLQTVTTVGYGDVTPQRASGRIIAGVVMLTAIGFLAVITAAATAALVEGGRRRAAGGSETDVAQRLAQLDDRLARIETALGPKNPGS